MQNELILEIENLGPINKADLDISLINVVVGENSTGKSALAKFLFCLLTALSKEGIYLANADIKNRLNQLHYLLKFNYFDEDSFNDDDLNPIEELLNKASSNELFDEICHRLYDLSKKISSPSLKEMYIKRLIKIQDLIKINKNRIQQYMKIFNTLLDSEFAYSLNDDINVNFTKGDDKFQIMSKEVFNLFNFENIVYIDSLSVFEFANNDISQNIEEAGTIITDKYPYHIQQLNRKLKNTNTKGIYDVEFHSELDVFKRKMDNLIGGNFDYDKENKCFLLKKDGKDYPMQNTSSGLKQLGIIQLLLENRELTENSFLILDEVELHLHPGLQVKLAKILVLMAKKLNITVFINTHSPFLAEAIEVYSRYYEIYDKTNFYLTQENGDKYDYLLVSDLDIMDVYDALGNPFDTINEIRFKTELRNN